MVQTYQKYLYQPIITMQRKQTLPLFSILMKNIWILQNVLKLHKLRRLMAKEKYLWKGDPLMNSIKWNKQHTKNSDNFNAVSCERIIAFKKSY